MKTSIFNMNFTLPPMVEMVEVEKDMPTNSYYCTVDATYPCGEGVVRRTHENIYL